MVKVKNVGTGKVVGKTKTNKLGNYAISAGSGAAKGTYQAKVKKKIAGRNICKKAVSNKVTVS